MLFNSISFLVFFAVVVAVYFALPRRWQWLWLLGASCYFYMQFVPIYITILFATIIIDYYAGIKIEESEDPAVKKRYLLLSIMAVCGILFAFKYFNFFNDNAAAIARAIGWNYPISALQIILPIGLSFHTFQSLSYVIEVYRSKQKAERHFGVYALYVMYFPQLVAGPIERPQNLLPQFHAERRFSLAASGNGLLLAVWGLFKKVVVADTAAQYVDAVYNHIDNHSGASLLVATYLFAIQIYCDFSGYSDIARGVSRVFGVELMKNFETPYFAKSISEFWSRWHISLSQWFRDYVYIPLGGNRVSLGRHLANLFAVFILSGLWHGANWTFIFWGALHGFYLVTERLAMVVRAPGPPVSSVFVRGVKVLLVFHLVAFAWIPFRAASVADVGMAIKKIAFDRGPLFPTGLSNIFCVVAVLVASEIISHHWKFWDQLPRFSLPWRWGVAVILLFSIILLGIESHTQFIYFQF